MMERTVYTRSVGRFLPRNTKSKKSFERKLKRKGKQAYRASGSRNRQPESTWNKGNVAMILIVRTE